MRYHDPGSSQRITLALNIAIKILLELLISLLFVPDLPDFLENRAEKGREARNREFFAGKIALYSLLHKYSSYIVASLLCRFT